jgi:hypothetical protein
MSHRCPICKTPLWKRPLLLRRLKCPRCGAEFRPTVPWAYFRLLLFLVLILSLTLVLVIFGENHWLLLLFLFAVAGFFWYLPKLVNLERIPGDLTVPEGPVTEGLQLELEYQRWNEPDESDDGRRVGGGVYYLAIILVLVLVSLLIYRLL